MHFFTLLLLAYAALTAAVTCDVRGQVHNYFDCFKCPALACGYSKRTFITKGLTRDVSCLWTDGERYKGINNWYYVPADKCYIWGGRIDTKQLRSQNPQVRALHASAWRAAASARGPSSAGCCRGGGGWGQRW